VGTSHDRIVRFFCGRRLPCAATCAGNSTSGAGSQAKAARTGDAGFADRHRLYTLPPTVAPIATDSKGAPLQWAISHPVEKALTQIGVWHDIGGGWSSLGLRLNSANASGMAVRLAGVSLPDKAEIWLCSPDGGQRRGPLRAGDNGELYTPVVTGAEAWLEILAPTRAVPRATVTLQEVYGGFR
jgi:hypothetical protein